MKAPKFQTSNPSLTAALNRIVGYVQYVHKLADRDIHVGENGIVDHTEEGINIRLNPAARRVNIPTGASPCPLGSLSSGSISTGWFIGGGISELIEPEVIEPLANQSVWLAVDWLAEEVDMVLQAGGTASNVTIHYGLVIPSDVVPNILSLQGTAYISLGGWGSDLLYTNAGCGNVNLSFCPGGFVKTRG